MGRAVVEGPVAGGAWTGASGAGAAAGGVAGVGWAPQAARIDAAHTPIHLAFGLTASSFTRSGYGKAPRPRSVLSAFFGTGADRAR